MPSRVLYDTLLTSESLARCSPRAQDAWARLILLADDFGCFLAHPRVLLGKGWPLREDVSEQDVGAWLKEFEAEGMVELWSDAGRTFGHMLSWDKFQRTRQEYHPVKAPHGSKRKTPAPPPPSRRQPAAAPRTSRAGNERAAGGAGDFPGKTPRTQSQSQSQSQSHHPPPPPPAGEAAAVDKSAQGGVRDAAMDALLDAAGEALWLAMQRLREEIGLPLEAERPEGFGTWYRAARGEGFGDQQLLDGYCVFATDASIRTARHPTSLWIRPKVWRQRVPPPRPKVGLAGRPGAPQLDARASMAWTGVLTDVQEAGKSYVAALLEERLLPVGLRGDVLTLWAPDALARDWVASELGPLVAALAAPRELSLEVTAPGPAPPVALTTISKTTEGAG